jgi:hypothetical protein
MQKVILTPRLKLIAADAALLQAATDGPIWQWARYRSDH